ncbi:probable isocitrate dehydrogenase [NAD] subunit alpha, mitochondrial [Drosophila grimshawi]|uniref:probable isocitrate dehydrogenase [NAD] subunit alpha, mitochondrial n=1 Tax=Drosophila grimshawi TaxID=7222 RepID=UPI000C870E67|nr:probable isocitrate dehydrogenase [NAD] subunit alpha, mitochondrial [Drosophila grimshawi]
MFRKIFVGSLSNQQSLVRSRLRTPFRDCLARNNFAPLDSRRWVTAMAREDRDDPCSHRHTRRRAPDDKQIQASRQPCNVRLCRRGKPESEGNGLFQGRQLLEPSPHRKMSSLANVDPEKESEEPLGVAANPPGPPKGSKQLQISDGSSSKSGGGGASKSGGITSTTKARVITLMPGDGIGPEISLAVLDVLKAVGAPLIFEPVDVTPVTDSTGKVSVPQAVIDSMTRTKLGLKGPLTTPVGKGFRSLNLLLRVLFNLYANVRPCRSLDGVETIYGKVDIITIRENTEGEYSGIEHQLANGVVQSIKLITRQASLRVAEYCFKYALAMKRKRITAVHKRSSMRMSDGLFINCVREVYEKYKDKLEKNGIVYEEQTIGKVCLKIVANPLRYDVLVMPNLYGDILSDTCAGLIGGLGLTPSGNVGINGAIFEAVHGTAPTIAGQDLANPTALLLSAAMMLRYIDMGSYADKIERAVTVTIRDDNVRTMDLGGKAKCSEFTKALIKNLN